MPWYREGTVTVTNGSKLVVGVDTFWDTLIEPGDVFCLLDANGLPTGPLYEVDRLVRDVGDTYYDSATGSNNPNRRMILKQNYQGSTASARAYAILNTTGEMTTPRFAARLQNYIETARTLNSKPNVTAQPNGIPMADGAAKIDSAWIKDATDTVKGAVELATAAEATAGNDTTRAITPSVSGSRITFATTSTDDATSATAAPLKSAGGLAVAKKGIFGESAQIRRQLVDGQTFTVAVSSTTRVTFVSSVTNSILAGGVDFSGRMASIGVISGAAWRIYGCLVASGEFFSHQVYKVEGADITISAPIWRSNTSFSIDITNASATNHLICAINANLSASSTALLSVSIATL